MTQEQHANTEEQVAEAVANMRVPDEYSGGRDTSYEGRACRALEKIAETLAHIAANVEALSGLAGCLRATGSDYKGTAFDVHVMP